MCKFVGRAQAYNFQTIKAMFIYIKIYKNSIYMVVKKVESQIPNMNIK